MVQEQQSELTLVLTELPLNPDTMAEVLKVPTELALLKGDFQLVEPKVAMQLVDPQGAMERKAVITLLAVTHLKPRYKSNRIRKMDNSSTHQTLQTTRKCSSVVSQSKQLPVRNHPKITDVICF